MKTKQNENSKEEFKKTVLGETTQESKISKKINMKHGKT